MPVVDEEGRMVLLGAGASVDAGVPASIDMTRLMGERLAEYDPYDLHRALAVLIGGLQMGSGWNTTPVKWEIDIERVMNAANVLASRFEEEIAPFVGTWHPVLEELESKARTRGLRTLSPFMMMSNVGSSEDLPSLLERAVREIAEAINSLIEAAGQRPNGTLFQQLSDSLTASLIHFTWIVDPTKTTYLDPLVKCAADHGISIGTLNYDNSIELSSVRQDLGCDLGIERWNEQGAFGVSATPALKLIKLHGSSDWSWNVGSRSHAGHFDGSTSKLRRVGKEDMDKTASAPPAPFAISPKPVVIFGGKNKLTADGPFLDLLYWFRHELQKASQLFTIGYSFRDDHINHPILAWLKGAQYRHVTIIDREGGELPWPRPQGFFPDTLLPIGRYTHEPIGAIAGIAKYFAI